MAETNKYLVLKGIAGMGNRILAFILALCYARLTQRKLFVDWTDGMYASKGSNAFYQFLDSPDVVSRMELHQSYSVYPKIWEGKLDRCLKDFSLGDMTAVEQLRMFSADVTKIDYEEDVLVMFDYGFSLDKFGPNVDKVLSYWPSLTPKAFSQGLLRKHLFLKPFVQNKVDQFYEMYFKNKVIIGVHIRNSDNQRVDDKRIDVNRFYDVVDPLLKEMPHAYIFLATDAQQTIDSYSEKYPNFLHSQKTVIREPGLPLHFVYINKKEMTEEAFIDLYLLSKCDFLVISGKSSFSRVAQFLSKAAPSNIFDIEYKELNKNLKRSLQIIAISSGKFSLAVFIDQMYLNILKFGGQSMKKVAPDMYLKLKKYFPDRAAGERV